MVGLLEVTPTPGTVTMLPEEVLAMNLHLPLLHRPTELQEWEPSQGLPPVRAESRDMYQLTFLLVIDTGGNGATTQSGSATGGGGDGFGPGGNAYSGSTGPSYGGVVYNSNGDGITNAAGCGCYYPFLMHQRL